MLVLVKTPASAVRAMPTLVETGRRHTQVVEGPESPCPSALLDGLNVIVDPSIRDGAALVGHLEFLQERLEARHFPHRDANRRCVARQKGRQRQMISFWGEGS
jgi:hypothetical protein